MLLKFSVAIVAAALCLMARAEEQPKYGGSFEPSNQDYLSSLADDSNGNGGGGGGFNETNAADAVIDTILNSGREGRNLDGFDEVYSDPNVQQALQKGDDRQARNVIKDKLCSLGLMECESEVQGKRPFLPPGELIYSQPPPGYRPQNGPGYGPARPMPPPQQQGNKYNGPPRKVGYASGSPFPVNGPNNYQNRPPGPIYVESKPPGPFYEGPSPPGPIYQGSRPPQGGQIFDGPKPPGPIYEGGSSGGAPYKFDTVASAANYHHEQHEKFETVQQDYPGGKPTIVVNAQGGGVGGAATAASSVNIHHHYHHLDGADKGPAVLVKPSGGGYVSGNNLLAAAEYSSTASGSAGGFNPSSGFVGVNSGGLGSAVNGISSSGSYGSGSYSATGSYKPISEPGNNYVGGSGYDGSVNSYGGAANGGASYGGLSSGSLGQYAGQSGSAAGSFGQTQQSFHSQNPNFYKKALNTNGGGANGLSSYSQANYNKYSSQSNGGQQGQFGATGSAGQFGTSGSGQYNTGENYQGFETARQDECTCVPYEQCPSQDVIGRKDDLILPLDPRHLKTDIEALEEDAIVGNTTSEESARVTKDATEKKEVDEKKDDKKVDETVKKVSKREAPVEGKAAKPADDKLDEDIGQADGEAVRYF